MTKASFRLEYEHVNSLPVHHKRSRILQLARNATVREGVGLKERRRG